jgi:hypothetical protein
MRAKPVITKAFVFDFDDTLFTTGAKVHVYDNDTGKFIKSLDSGQFNKFHKLPSQFLDFHDFTDNSIILRGKPLEAFTLLKEVDQEISDETLFGDIYILTARTPHVQKGIYDVLKKHGIKNIKGNHIICMGDGRGEIDIPEIKKKELMKIAKNYDKVYFYDDSKKTIDAVKHLSIKSYLIEEYIKK